MQTTQFDTKPLLRPAQAEEAKTEIMALEAKLQSPNIEDKGEVRKQLIRMRKTVESQLPKPPINSDEEGRMVARERQLLEEIVPAMCSQEEMRKAPTGAVDKFMHGENSPAIKEKILEWKNLRLRLRPGEAEAANLERYRPKDSTLNMDNAYIPGKQFYLPPAGAGLPVTFSEDQLAMLRKLDPKLADMLALLTNAQRGEVKNIVAQAAGIGLVAESPELEGARKNSRPGKRMTPDQRKAWGAKMKAARAAKKAA